MSDIPRVEDLARPDQLEIVTGNAVVLICAALDHGDQRDQARQIVELWRAKDLASLAGLFSRMAEGYEAARDLREAEAAGQA